MPIRAVTYARVSLARSDESDSVTRQQAICVQYATARSWEVVASERDVGVSGWSGADRPGWLAVEQLVRTRAVDAVVVFAISRAARNTIRLLEFKRLCDEHGVELHSATEPISGAYGQVFVTLLAALAELESETKSQRLVAQRLEQAQAGRLHGGRRLYGYTDAMRTSLVQDEVQVVREVAALALSGSSMYALSTMLNDRGVQTTEGKRWTPSNLRKLLLRPGLAGLRYHAPSGTTVQGTWPAILSEDEHARLVALLTAPTRAAGPGKRGNRKALLSGLLRCTECGVRLKFITGKARYKDEASGGGCARCSAPSRAIELAVLQLAEVHAQARALTVPTHQPDVTGTIEELRDLDARLVTLVEMLSDGELNRASYGQAVARVEHRRRDLEAVLRDAGVQSDDYRERIIEAVQQWSSGQALDDVDVALLQDSIVQALGVPVIWVAPGEKYARTFEPSRLSLTRE